jgi:hypothetical protein
MNNTSPRKKKSNRNNGKPIFTATLHHNIRDVAIGVPKSLMTNIYDEDGNMVRDHMWIASEGITNNRPKVNSYKVRIKFYALLDTYNIRGIEDKITFKRISGVEVIKVISNKNKYKKKYKFKKENTNNSEQNSQTTTVNNPKKGINFKTLQNVVENKISNQHILENPILKSIMNEIKPIQTDEFYEVEAQVSKVFDILENHAIAKEKFTKDGLNISVIKSALNFAIKDFYHERYGFKKLVDFIFYFTEDTNINLVLKKPSDYRLLFQSSHLQGFKTVNNLPQRVEVDEVFNYKDDTDFNNNPFAELFKK